MKNIKYIVIGMMISFILIFIVSSISSYMNRNKTIHINEYESATESIDNLNSKIDKLKVDETCKISLKYMSNRIKENVLTGDVKLKDYYESFYKEDLTFIDYYNYVVSSCSIDNNPIIYNKAMSTLVYPNYIKDRYNRSYELHIVDPFFNDTYVDETGTYSTIFNEISTLNDLIEVLS